jgi:hypothetical protein
MGRIGRGHGFGYLEAWGGCVRVGRVGAGVRRRSTVVGVVVGRGAASLALG